ncbi:MULTISPECIES: fimbrial protein [Stenotrophomonas]|uniref:fimbrial protein n=1 Tax=Stenotrophomonas TaxID=40323 RepID=UPI00201D2141|nr:MULTISPECIES: fimbrial protein [Stenotrophomonas]MBN5026327.1 type 1 fimbrial protein [Stenotrophomonas maltophilia]MDH1275178.1 type 1 fimbrial protein [Stenotrophomonas sp. GD03937]MDH1484414.1 type 1 fimbrial protein [Stenotrophomonas sp. GD03712]UQY93977.1 type 1 fimbrial protein [Stenotrophomonas maltophilia]WON69344.1 fimbrial protein [Stenotrophomonas maltophilia]
MTVELSTTPTSTCRLAVLLALLSIPLMASADSVVLDINGRLLPGTCTLSAPAIALDPVRAGVLSVGGNALKAGQLEFTGCIGVAQAVLSFDGLPADGDADRWKNTAAADAATGVSIVLLEGATGNTHLKHGSTGIVVPVSGTGAVYPLRAGYYRPDNRGVNAGQVQASITVTAAYR